jgi:hypothetical protein
MRKVADSLPRDCAICGRELLIRTREHCRDCARELHENEELEAYLRHADIGQEWRNYMDEK